MNNNDVKSPADLNEEQILSEPNCISDAESNDRLVNLSFVDGGVKVSRVGERTIVSMLSYFRADKLCKFMNYLGYTNMPDVMTNTLKKYGYTYNYKLGGYVTKTTGIVILDPRDNDNEIAAVNMATTKAKVKAYDRAARCLMTIRNVIADTMILFDDAYIALNELYLDENEALNRVIKTGYCNPDKQ